MQPLPGAAEEQSQRFEQTHWSVVMSAGGSDDASESARTALAQLCQTYWTPLYGFIRSRGHSVPDAQDLTQGFFLHLIQHRIHTRTNPARGKFRSFLLASVKHFLADAYDRENALKRGGGQEFLPLREEQAQAAEASFQSSVVSEDFTVEDRLFDRQWAQTLIAMAFDRLAAEFAAEGKSQLFGALEVFLRGGAEAPPTYVALAGRLAMPAATIRSHVTRLRARYRAALRAELRRTVDTEEEVDEELRELLRALTAH